jgi:hypothetical protein
MQKSTLWMQALFWIHQGHDVRIRTGVTVQNKKSSCCTLGLHFGEEVD